jgi:hypothetical protein
MQVNWGERHSAISKAPGLLPAAPIAKPLIHNESAAFLCSTGRRIRMSNDECTNEC